MLSSLFPAAPVRVEHWGAQLIPLLERSQQVLGGPAAFSAVQDKPRVASAFSVPVRKEPLYMHFAPEGGEEISGRLYNRRQKPLISMDSSAWLTLSNTLITSVGGKIHPHIQIVLWNRTVCQRDQGIKGQGCVK